MFSLVVSLDAAADAAEAQAIIEPNRLEALRLRSLVTMLRAESRTQSRRAA